MINPGKRYIYTYENEKYILESISGKFNSKVIKHIIGSYWRIGFEGNFNDSSENIYKKFLLKGQEAE